MSSVVLISGASGFIGSHLCRYFADAGFVVRIIGRRPVKVGADIEQFIVRDLRDRAAVSPAFTGVDWVIHAAGLAHVTRESTAISPEAFRMANVETSRTFANCAVSASCSALLLIGSVAAADDAVTTHPRERLREAYAHSKRDAESAVLSATARTGVRCIVLRAPMVYGPGMKGNPLRLLRSLQRGLPLPLAGIQNRRAAVYVLNLAAATRFALETRDLRGVFYVDDGEARSTSELARSFIDELGVPDRLFYLPPAIFRAAAAFGDVINRFIPFPLNSDAVDQLTGSTHDAPEAARVPGFTPPYTTREGVRQTVAAYKSASAGT